MHVYIDLFIYIYFFSSQNGWYDLTYLIFISI
jgi:hypothetical protein